MLASVVFLQPHQLRAHMPIALVGREIVLVINGLGGDES